MTERLTPDVCIIGAGSAGLTAAAAVAAFGVEVVLVERDRMGGDCLNYGCVPSKSLLAAAHRAKAIAEAPRFGLETGEIKVDFSSVHDHVQEIIASIAPNDSVERFTALGVRVVRASAEFVDARTVVAGDVEIRARRFVVATGSSPAVPAIPGLDAVPYLTNETLFRCKEKPRHLVVIGGGPVGIEMAQAFRRLGSEVTVIEAARALGKDDPDLAAVVLDRLRSEGVEIIENARVTAVEPQGASGVRVLYEGGKGSGRIDSSTLLLAAGRMPNVEGLGLEKAGIAHGKRGITVGAGLRTTNRRVYAIGDVVGGLQFTHVAGYHAGLVVQQILFRIPARVNRDVIPWAIYTDPPLAHVGLAEEEARRRHRSIRVLRWPYAENDRAQAERRTEGLVKIVTNRRGRILGASIVGADADEMINIWALAVSKRMTVADIRSYVAPYPTLAEIGKRAALTYYDPLTRKPFVRMAVRLLRRLG